MQHRPRAIKKNSEQVNKAREIKKYREREIKKYRAREIKKVQSKRERKHRAREIKKVKRDGKGKGLKASLRVR